MAAGATSIIETFQRTLLVNGNHQAGLYLGLLNKNGFKDRHYPNVFYRRWTDPNFDFEKELALLLTQKQVDTGRSFNSDEDFDASDFAYQFKQYDKITPVYYLRVWWERSDPKFLKSPHRKRLIREMGIYDYWRKYGYPPQCRAVGEDDFECD
ncbi:MAG: hypothetical protein ACJAS9_000595 [Polaribacter sp.]|jgi:hypothetical protein